MRYWTSDLHLSHANIIDFCNRPYDSVDEMNEDIIRIWNETVSNDDEVWVIGDLAMGQIRESLSLIPRLNGDIILICGNHDRPWAGHSEKRRGGWKAEYMNYGIAEVWTNATSQAYTTNIGTWPVDVCHFPYAGESRPGKEDRFSGNRPYDRGLVLLHGHVHDMWRVNGRQINVGWDIWNRPISDGEIYRIIKDEIYENNVP